MLLLASISNEKSEARISEAPEEEISNTLTIPPEVILTGLLLN